MMRAALSVEHAMLRNGLPLPGGSSLLMVARAT